MEDRYQHTIPGTEVSEVDINLIATDAALADDHVFAELFRLGAGLKGVTVASGGASAIIQPSGSANAQVKINPFRAFIGALSPTTAADAYKNIRSGIAASTVGTNPNTITLPDATNNRWDLIYARVDVDIDGPTVQRFVKTGTTASTQTPVVATKKTTVTLGRVAGFEATTPAKPALPADSGSSYYIALGYVLLPAGHTITTAISKTRIDEVAPVINVAPAAGAMSVRIANGQYAESGPVLANETWTPATGRPQAYLPPTMGGGMSLFIALRELSTPRTVTLGATATLDDSIDWRKRLWRVTASFTTSGGFTWNATQGLPGTTLPVLTVLSQSMHDPVYANKSALILLDNTTTSGVMAAGSTLLLYVDKTDGKIKCDMGATAPGCNFIFWLECTGQFDNAN